MYILIFMTTRNAVSVYKLYAMSILIILVHSLIPSKSPIPCYGCLLKEHEKKLWFCQLHVTHCDTVQHGMLRNQLKFWQNDLCSVLQRDWRYEGQTNQFPPSIFLILQKRQQLSENIERKNEPKGSKSSTIVHRSKFNVEWSLYRRYSITIVCKNLFECVFS